MQLSFCLTAGINRAGMLTGLPKQHLAVLYPISYLYNLIVKINTI